jgi:hypothetical protein
MGAVLLQACKGLKGRCGPVHQGLPLPAPGRNLVFAWQQWARCMACTSSVCRSTPSHLFISKAPCDALPDCRRLASLHANFPCRSGSLLAVHSSYNYRIQQPQLVDWEQLACRAARARQLPPAAAAASEGAHTLVAQLLPRGPPRDSEAEGAVLGAVVATASRLTVGGTIVRVEVRGAVSLHEVQERASGAGQTCTKIRGWPAGVPWPRQGRDRCLQGHGGPAHHIACVRALPTALS